VVAVRIKAVAVRIKPGLPVILIGVVSTKTNADDPIRSDRDGGNTRELDRRYRILTS
jgi:hypothetical protein